MSKNVLFLNASWEQEALVRSIYKQGHNIITVSQEEPSYREIIKKNISSDISNIASILNISKLYSIDSIISDNCDYSLLSTEIISELLNLPQLGLNSARISNNKYLQRDLCSKHNINQPKFELVKSFDQAKHFRKVVSPDVLIKPLDSRGSMGISFLNKSSQDSDLALAIAKALSASPSKQCLIEEYINGELLTIDGFLNDSLCIPIGIAKRKRISKGLIVTNEIIYSSSIDKQTSNKCINFLKGVASALSYSNGHIHCEALLDDSNTLYLVECTNRGAGVFTSSTINPYISDLPINEYLSNLKLGHSIHLNKIQSEFKQRDASLSFPSLGNPGQIIYRCDYKGIIQNEKVLGFKLFSRIGRPLLTPSDGPSRHFAIALATSDKKEISTTIDHIINNFFTIK